MDDLLTFDEYQAELDRVAGDYQERVHSMIGMSPHVSYHNHLRKSVLRPASDVLNVMTPVPLTVTAGGIEHRKRRFAANIGGEPVETGRVLQCKPDPLLRGIWAEVDGLTYFFMPVDAFAREQNPGIWVRDQRERTKDASEAGADALNAQIAKQMAAPRKFEQMEDIAGPADTAATKGAPADSKQEAESTGAGAISPAAAEKPSGTKPANKPGRSKPAMAEVPQPVELPAAVPDTAPSRRLPRGVVPPRNPNLKIVR